MNELITYPQQAVTEGQAFNIKKTIAVTLLGGAAACAIYYFVKKQVKDNKASRSDAKGFQSGSPATLATEVNLALTTGTLGPNIEGLRQILTGIKSKEELDKVKDEYKNQYGKEFNLDIKSKIQLSEYEELVAIANAKPENGKPVSNEVKYKLWATRIKAAFDKKWLGFDSIDTNALQAALKEIPTQTAFINVGKEYGRAYHDNVMTVIKNRLHFWEVDTYTKMITDKPKGK